MVFDGKNLTSFDNNLLDDLKRAQGVPLEPDDAMSPSGGGSRRPRRDRQIGAAVMAAFVVLVLVAGGVLAARSGGDNDDANPNLALDDQGLAHGVAEQQVLAALEQTTAAGNFDLRYQFSETLGSGPPSTICYETRTLPYINGETPDWTVVPRQQSTPKDPGGDNSLTETCNPTSHDPVTVTGSGTVNIEPKAMSVSAHVTSATTGLDVTVSLEGDQVSESGDFTTGPNQTLSTFAGTVEGTLGLNQGALAMTRMASPNGYLALEQSSVNGAAVAGTGTVDGVPVTNYTVGIDLDQLRSTPGLTADETKTINDALDVLHSQGYANTLDTISVDGDGFIRKVLSVSTFDDGATVTYDGTSSNFGCAGTSPDTVTCPDDAVTTSPPVTADPDGSIVPPTSEAPSTTMPPAATTTRPESTTTTS